MKPIKRFPPLRRAVQNFFAAKQFATAIPIRGQQALPDPALPPAKQKLVQTFLEELHLLL